MLSALSSDMVKYAQNVLLEIKANDKLFSLVTAMIEYLKRPNSSETSAVRIDDKRKPPFF